MWRLRRAAYLVKDGFGFVKLDLCGGTSGNGWLGGRSRAWSARI